MAASERPSTSAAAAASGVLHVDVEPVRVGLVGLGVIGTVHRTVLAARHDVRLAFLADITPIPAGTAARVPSFGSLSAALDAHSDVDLVVVATPTDTHLELVAEVLERTDAGVLSEKPLTRDMDALERLRRDHAGALGRIRTVNHFAFSPEVVWAAEVVRRGQWGPPRRVISCFDDPYVTKSADERRTYVNSWVDSGANQLALLARFTEGWSVTAHEVDPVALRSVTEVAYDGGSATLVSNWWTGASSKQSSLRWDDDRELVLDHTSMTGVALEGGRVREHLGSDGTLDRKVAHYAAMYQAVLDGSEARLLGFELAHTIARQLSAGADARAGHPEVLWSLPARR